MLVVFMGSENEKGFRGKPYMCSVQSELERHTKRYVTKYAGLKL